VAFRQVPENVNMLDGLLSAPVPPKAVDNGAKSATAKDKEAKKKPAEKKTQKKSVAKKTTTTKSKSPTSVAGSTEAVPLAAAVSAEEEGWKYIDTAETLVFLFQEKDHYIPYSMEVIWVVPGKGEFFMEESFTGFNGRCAEKFIPLIEDATKRRQRTLKISRSDTTMEGIGRGRTQRFLTLPRPLPGSRTARQFWNRLIKVTASLTSI